MLTLGERFGRPVPATELEIADNLRETVAYSVQHLRIKELAAQAIGDARDDMEKINRLVPFVFDYVEDSIRMRLLNVQLKE